MQSFICFIVRLNLNFHSLLIVSHEYRGIMDKCTLNRATNLLPGVLFVVELESYCKNDHFVNVYSYMPLLLRSLQIV